MVITITYEDGVDVFDTAERVDPATHQGNALANWSIRLEDARQGDALGGKRLWLDLYLHDMPDPGAAPGPRGLPAAPRRDAATFLLADESDVSRMLRVAVNGDTVLLRVGDELVNAARFAHAADLSTVYNPQAESTRAYLEAALGDSAPGDPAEAICAMMGYSPEAMALAEQMERASS